MIFLGTLSDWYGRKRTFIIYTIFTFAIAIGNYFVDDPYAYLVLRFFGGIGFLAMSTAKNVWQVNKNVNKMSTKITILSIRLKLQVEFGDQDCSIGFMKCFYNLEF